MLVRDHMKAHLFSDAIRVCLPISSRKASFIGRDYLAGGSGIYIIRASRESSAWSRR